MIPDKYKEKVTKGKSHWLERDSDTARFTRILKQLKGKLDGLSALDAGCAQGRDTAEIADYEIKATGIDINEEFIQEARRIHPGVQYDIGSIEQLPYEDGQFDAVYCVNTLFYTNPEKSLPELERVLKASGIAFVTLDKRIVDLDKDKEIHSQDIDEALQQFRHCKVISKTYREREDEHPFRHKHFYYEVVLQKE